MYSKMKVLTIVAALMLIATANAAIVIPPSGGGGGNISLVVEPINPRFESRTEMPGYQSYLTGSNNQRWYHQWESNEGHWHEAESTGYYNFRIDQGFMGNQYLPIESGIGVVRWDDQGNFNIRAEFKMVQPEFLPADYLNTPSGGTSWNAFGINYNTNISLGHQTIWEWETETEIETADVTGWFSYNFQDSLLIDAIDRVSEWQMWTGEDTALDGIRLTAWFNVQYVGKNLDTFNSIIGLAPADYDAPASMVIPEPTTMLLLGAGATLLLRRKRRR